MAGADERPRPAFNELDGWPKENWAMYGNFTAQRRVICAWDDRHDVIEHLAWAGGEPYPYVRVLSRTPTGAIDTYELTNAFATGAAVAPFCGMDEAAAGDYHSFTNDYPWSGGAMGKPIGLADYEKAVVTVDYSTDAIGLERDLLTEELRPFAQYDTVNVEKMQWPDGSAVNKPAAPAHLTRGMEYIMTYYRAPSVPLTLVESINSCNHAAVSAPTLGVSFPAETLLYTGYNATRTLSYSSIATWKITLRMLYRPASWNQFWNSAAAVTVGTGNNAETVAGAYQPITVVPGGATANRTYRPYPLINFDVALHIPYVV